MGAVDMLPLIGGQSLIMVGHGCPDIIQSDECNGMEREDEANLFCHKGPFFHPTVD